MHTHTNDGIKKNKNTFASLFKVQKPLCSQQWLLKENIFVYITFEGRRAAPKQQAVQHQYKHQGAMI